MNPSESYFRAILIDLPRRCRMLSHSAPVLLSAASALPQYFAHTVKISRLPSNAPETVHRHRQSGITPAAPCREPRVSAKAEPPAPPSVTQPSPRHHPTELFTTTGRDNKAPPTRFHLPNSASSPVHHAPDIPLTAESD